MPTNAASHEGDMCVVTWMLDERDQRGDVVGSATFLRFAVRVEMSESERENKNKENDSLPAQSGPAPSRAAQGPPPGWPGGWF